MPIPLLDLQGQYAPLRQDILAAIARVCDSQRFIGGHDVEAFDREIAAYIGVPHAIGLTSRTDAFLVALMALGLGPGEEVITPTFSVFATAGAVTGVGATPKFVDVDPLACNLDPRSVEAAITPRTRAIIPVHLYGQCADMDPILDIGGNFRLDALQAAVLRVKLPHLDRWTAMGRRNADRYERLFAASAAAPRIALPARMKDCGHILNQYTIRVPQRDAAKARLDAAGIGTEIYYPVPFHLQECFARLGYRAGDFPMAEAAAAEALALPIYGELPEAQQREVVDAVARAVTAGV
jgi:dTDP-4-amino-4,6-dideoxygalactose transaminase